MATLATLRADLRDFAGLKKVTPDEADALLNEGDAKLCVRSEWTRATLELGPTVIGQGAYALPDSVHRVLDVRVNGKPFGPSNATETSRITSGELRLATWGLWLLTNDADGDEFVTLYGTPGTAGLTIEADCVVFPAPMEEDDDTPASPRDFHSAVRDYAASKIYGFSEDSTDLREYHETKFDQEVERLRRLRLSRGGRGDVRLKIEGMTA